MLEVANRTEFIAACFPHADVGGGDVLVVVIKGTFRIRPGSDVLKLADEQAPVVWADAFYGAPGASSVRYESDVSPPKIGGDVVLIGSAYPQRGKDRQAEVSVSLGPLKKTVRVVGDRAWHKSLTGWQPTAPALFEQMPLVFERAFGGRDGGGQASGSDSYEPRNPVGAGFVAAEDPERLEGLPLPNLEDPAHPIKSWKDRPAPACFGVVARHWAPRSALAGTYDEAWQADRCPLLPADFDPRYFNAASAGLVAPSPFGGGEQVVVTGAHRSGDLSFRLPARRLAVTAWVKGEPRRAAPSLDTVVIEPDDERLVLVWRAAIPCTREFLHIRNVFIKETE